MFTSRDVAQRAGVSQSTVSYVLSGKRPISEKTRRRVEAAMAELTWQPNAGAQALASQRTQVIGLVAPFGGTIDASGLLPFLEVIAGRARERDYDVLLVTVDEGPSALTRLAGRRLCDALVVMEVEAKDPRVAVAASLAIPVIFIGVPDEPGSLRCVDLDFDRAGQLGVVELAAAGCRHVVVVGHDAPVIARDINYVRRFERGVRGAAADLQVGVEVVAPVEPSPTGAAWAAEQIIARGAAGELPGVLVPNTNVLQRLLTALIERGCTPGQDVHVVGLCTDAAAAAMVPALSNVSFEPRDVSRRAMDTLFRLLDPDGSGPPGSVDLVDLVEPRLTRRSTTSVP